MTKSGGDGSRGGSGGGYLASGLFPEAIGTDW